MKKRDHYLRHGNDRFEGFAVDLIYEVAKMLEFDYEIYLVNDGKFGNKLSNGEWNGMIGELLSGVCTIIIFLFTGCQISHRKLSLKMKTMSCRKKAKPTTNLHIRPTMDKTCDVLLMWVYAHNFLFLIYVGRVITT
jgi:hypothetical protein